MRKKAAIAMSGGVDSSVAAALMLEEGFNCFGFTLRLFNEKILNAQGRQNGCGPPADVNDAKNAAAVLGIDHFAVDLSCEFEKNVVRRFIETYEKGATPNPCVDCNRRIKFNLCLLQESLKAHNESFNLLATGHYARVFFDKPSGRFLLQKALDESKDQSYVLYSLSQQQLEQLRFPLGGLSKKQAREIAEEKGLANARKAESQDICFVPEGDYASFIERYAGKNFPQGDIIDTEGKIIGRHRGIIRYTIGQRRGLGVAANMPVYVTSKSAENNTVTLGPDSALYAKSLSANNINLIAVKTLEKPMRVKVKTRYLQEAKNATARQTGEDSLYIEFDSPQRAIAPGQAAVMYEGDIVIGGGTIA